MKKLFIFLTLALAVAFTAVGQENKIKFTEYDLANGLHVILHQDNSTPNVVVGVMYHVGTKNEEPTKTGFAHFFEHLMFEGSENIARGDYMKIVEANGGALNANTGNDRTYYFELMPSNQLELALWMEAERMLHAKIDTIGVNTQKGVVIEERNQVMDNRPYGSFLEQIAQRAFKIHPYRWVTIGDPEHIRNADFNDIYNFYTTFYVPNNAVLVVSGDFQEAQAKKWINDYFASIPKGTKPIFRPTVVEPPLGKEVRDTIYDKIQLPAVFMGYRSPAMGTKDAYAFEILKQILSGGASSRLTANITDKGKAMETVMFYIDSEHPGITYVIGFPNIGGDVLEVENAMNDEFEKISKELVTQEEFQKAIAKKEFSIVQEQGSLRSITEMFANNYTYFKDAARINNELQNYSSLTREDILNVAKKYLHKDNRVVLYYLPESAKQ